VVAESGQRLSALNADDLYELSAQFAAAKPPELEPEPEDAELDDTAVVGGGAEEDFARP